MKYTYSVHRVHGIGLQFYSSRNPTHVQLEGD